MLVAREDVLVVGVDGVDFVAEVEICAVAIEEDLNPVNRACNQIASTNQHPISMTLRRACHTTRLACIGAGTFVRNVQNNVDVAARRR